MPEDVGEAQENPAKTCGMHQRAAQDPLSKKLPYLLILIVPGTLLVRGIMAILDAHGIVRSSQSVDHAIFVAFMLIGAPIVAKLSWQSLLSASVVRHRWEAKLLVFSAVVVVIGINAFALMSLALPALLPTTFSAVLLFSTIGALLLFIFSVVVMLIHHASRRN